MFICVKRICFCEFLLFISCRFKSFDYDRNDFFQYISFQKLQNRRIHQFSTKKKKIVSSFFINQKSFSYHDTANNRYVYIQEKKPFTHFHLHQRRKKIVSLHAIFSTNKSDGYNVVSSSHFLGVSVIHYWFSLLLLLLLLLRIRQISN